MSDPLYLAWWNLENLFDTERRASRSFPPGSRAGLCEFRAPAFFLQPAEILRGKLGVDGIARQPRAGSAFELRATADTSARAGGSALGFSRVPAAPGSPPRIWAGWRNRGSQPFMFDQLLVSRGLLTGESDY